MPVLRATRLRRAAALVMALAFVMLSATSVLAAASAQPDTGDSLFKAGLLLKQAPGQGDADDSGQPGSPHARSCPCHAVTGGNPEPYELTVSVAVIDGILPLPERFLRSRPATPPIRPPCI